MAPALNQKRAETAVQIPDRLYFKISDVASICSVAATVLRFWETQFPQLKPSKSGTGQRLYRRRDVEQVLEIKRLVYEEGYTIAGARQAMSARSGARVVPKISLPVEPQIEISEDSVRTVGSAAVGADGLLWQRDTVAATIGHTRAELRALLGLLGQSEPQRKRPKIRIHGSDFAMLFPVE